MNPPFLPELISCAPLNCFRSKERATAIILSSECVDGNDLLSLPPPSFSTLDGDSLLCISWSFSRESALSPNQWKWRASLLGLVNMMWKISYMGNAPGNGRNLLGRRTHVMAPSNKDRRQRWCPLNKDINTSLFSFVNGTATASLSVHE